jgi:hypothetical protein
MGSRMSFNHAAFGRQVLRSEGMRANMDARAQRVAEQFRATAPVGEPAEPDEHAGRFRDSAVVSSGTAGGPEGDRAYGRVTLEDPAAMSIEYGHVAEFDEHGRFATRGTGVRTQYIPGSHTLTAALDAAGDA